MLTLRKVAITGGLSSGKSTVCRFLAEEGAYVVSADEIVHSLQIKLFVSK
jgi:dephospho-CoA kinase